MSLKVTLQASRAKELQNCDLFFCITKSEEHCLTGVLISPYPDLFSDVFYLMVRIFRLMVVLLYTHTYI
jgi:hypothetical protein